MNIDPAEFSKLFFEEAAEHVASLESGLLLWEKHPGDPEQLNAIFRAAHSIKGGSASFGFNDVARFTHVLEGLLEGVRQGQRVLDQQLCTLLLEANDALRLLLAAAQAGRPSDPQAEALLVRLGQELAKGGAGHSAAAGASHPAPAPQASFAAGGAQDAPAPAAARQFLVHFLPATDLFRHGGDPVLLLRELASLGDLLEVRADFSRLPPLEELDPESCYAAWSVRLATTHTEAEVRDVFCFVDDGHSVRIEALPALAAVSAAAAPAPGKQQRTAGDGVIRVAVEKVDQLVNLVGELVITQSMVRQALEDGSAAGLRRLREAFAEMERNTRELQERVMGVRMVPIGTVFNRFPRLLRDLAPALGKQVTLELSGEETELDKGLVERIGDPLTHLVRNAADHGIETPEERRAAGKPEHGTVRLSARHQGGAILIEISDDGRGLDLTRIRQKAIEQGLIAPETNLSVHELQQLIFLPGFSTAKVVSDVSGRGVGMDVVKSNIEALNGSVHFESAAGKGTTCRIRLPLTLAILDGLTLRVGSQLFVLPLGNILESFRPREGEVRTVLDKGEVVVLRGETVPLVRLHRVFGLVPEHAEAHRGLVSVLDAGGAKVALLVDELLGQAQVVVKGLEQNYRRVEGVTGATILGDGRVALILDASEIARLGIGGGRSRLSRAAA